VWECGNSEGSEGKQAEWNRVSVMGQRGKFEFYALLNRN